MEEVANMENLDPSEVEDMSGKGKIHLLLLSWRLQ